MEMNSDLPLVTGAQLIVTARSLDDHERVLFALASAEAMFPLNEVCRGASGLEGGDALRRELDLLWAASLAGNAHVEEMESRVLAFIPFDDDPGWSIERAIASSATAAIAYAARVVAAYNAEAAGWAAFQVYDAAEARWQFRAEAGASLANDSRASQAVEFTTVALPILVRATAIEVRDSANVWGMAFSKLFV